MHEQDQQEIFVVTRQFSESRHSFSRNRSSLASSCWSHWAPRYPASAAAQHLIPPRLIYGSKPTGVAAVMEAVARSITPRAMHALERGHLATGSVQFGTPTRLIVHVRRMLPLRAYQSTPDVRDLTSTGQVRHHVLCVPAETVLPVSFWSSQPWHHAQAQCCAVVLSFIYFAYLTLLQTSSLIAFAGAVDAHTREEC